MDKKSRRAFLRQAMATAALFSAGKISSWGVDALASSQIRGWLTDGERRCKEIAVPPWQPSSPSVRASIEIDPSQRFQSVLGFGGAFTDASCYLLSRMESTRRKRLLEELLGANGLRFSVGRTCIGSSDYSRSAYSFDDSSAPDPELKNFSIAHDCAYILPMLREAKQVNSELFLTSAPWSPPGWMKTGGSLMGGSMRKRYFASYAEYFVKFLKAYQDQGITVGAVTTQNEVDTDQDGKMPAALWGQEYEIGFIKRFLGPALRNASLDTKIWLLDHNYDLWGRVMDELSDPQVFQYVDGVAWHGYSGSPSVMSKVHDAFPSKHAYWTEGGPDISDPNYASDWAKWSGVFAGILKNWARCILSWNLLLDEKGGPNIGPFRCGGLVTLNSKTQQITRSGQYWAFAHYSKAVRRGAQVIASEGTSLGIEHVAFANPSGDFVLVLTNQAEDRAIDCRFQDKLLHLNLPADSIVTLQWS